MDLQALMKFLLKTDVTKTTHSAPYDAISPARPELSQAGKVILITGGGTAVGNAIGRAFVRASADTIIIVGRRSDVLRAGAERLEKEAEAAGTSTKVIDRSLDVTDFAAVDALWADLAEKGVIVDVLVCNAAMFSKPEPMLNLGTENVWDQMEVNVKAPLYLANKFYSQGVEKQKFIVHVCSQVAHQSADSGLTLRPAYSLTKTSSALAFQLVAQDVPAEKMQIISIHPGLLMQDEWLKISPDLTPDMFTNEDLPGSFAVWAATKEASFLHGRFAWASWDVEELSTGALRKRIAEDPYFLRVTVGGL